MANAHWRCLDLCIIGSDCELKPKIARPKRSFILYKFALASGNGLCTKGTAAQPTFIEASEDFALFFLPLFPPPQETGGAQSARPLPQPCTSLRRKRNKVAGQSTPSRRMVAGPRLPVRRPQARMLRFTQTAKR